MARVGIIFGLLLCGLTVVGLVSSLSKIPVQFIPMMLGIPILFCGVVALNPHRRKYAMRVSVILAALGTVAGGGRASYAAFRWFSGESINVFALKMVLAMSAVCIAFIILSVLSSVQAGRRQSDDLPSHHPGSPGDPQGVAAKRSELEAVAMRPD